MKTNGFAEWKSYKELWLFLAFGGGVVDDVFGESLSWENSIKYDQILLISLSNFRIYGIKKVKFNYLGDEILMKYFIEMFK